MPRHVRLLLSSLDSEDANSEIRVDEQVAEGVCHDDLYLLDFFFFYDLLMDKWFLHIDIQNSQVALLI